MPSNRRWSVSDGRKLATGILIVLAFFIISASMGAQSWELAALGVAVLVAGVALYVVSAMNNRSFAYVPGTAHVISSTPPPAGTLQGRCEMQVVVHAPGMDDVTVKIRDVGVPVSKWPDAGATLPILVATADPRRVRVLWENVRTHGEIADARGEIFDGEMAVDEPYDLFDDFPAGAPGGGDVYGEARVLEFDIDPTGVYLESTPPIDAPEMVEPGTPRADATATATIPEQSGPATVNDEPAAGTAPEPGGRTQPEPGRNGTGGPAGGGPLPTGGEPGRGAAEPGLPRRPRPLRRPSPRPRRSVESTEPSGSMVNNAEPDGVDGGSQVAVVDRPAAPAPPSGSAPVAGPAAAPPGVESSAPRGGAQQSGGGERPTLRVQNLVPASPAVPAIPDSSAAHGAMPEEARGEISEAYLAITPPPGQEASPGREQGAGVTLFVSNLGRSVAFYRDLLGFEQVDVGSGSAVLESGGGRIELRRVPDMAPVDRRLVHLLLEVPDVHAAYEELRTRGVEFVHRPRAVSRYQQLELRSAAFRDPDGHGIALTRWDVPA